MKTLRQLFAMPPETRALALAAARDDIRLDGDSPSPSTPVSSVSSSEDNVSIKSSHSQTRQVGKSSDVKKLAKYLCKNYFSAMDVWEHLYNDNNRIINRRFNRILDQLEEKLTRQQAKILKHHRKKVTKELKKKMSAARVYRLKLLEKGKKIDAPKCKEIDLTLSDSDEATVDNADETITNVKAEKSGKKSDKAKKSDDKGADTTDDEGADTTDDKGAETSDKAHRRKQLAKKFLAKMKQLRESRQKGSSNKPKRSKNRSKSKNKSSKGSAKNKSSKGSAPDKTTDEGGKTTDEGDDAPVRNNKRSAPDNTTDEGDDAPPRKSNRSAPTFKKGTRVMGQWKGPEYKDEWYEGVIQSVHSRKRTASVLYDDGCVDDNLKWTQMRIIDN